LGFDIGNTPKTCRASGAEEKIRRRFRRGAGAVSFVLTTESLRNLTVMDLSVSLAPLPIFLFDIANHHARKQLKSGASLNLISPKRSPLAV
jgi:hypothetical protein